jgi:hypothetical protein
MTRSRPSRKLFAAGREDATRVALDVPLLLLTLAGAEVQRAIEPDGDSGVTCGRPSARTVESQNTSAFSSSSSAVAHASRARRQR